MIEKYTANGKLLLTGEYFVLDGAKALAVPTNYGQALTLFKEDNASTDLSWNSFDANGELWFSASFNKNNLACIQANDKAVATRLEEIFQVISILNPSFSEKLASITRLETRLDFPRNWGLGTSSTLIAMLAEWSGVDKFQLLEKTFGGSGYDLACANAERSLLYQLKPSPCVESVDFNPSYAENLAFVYLNRKQNSRKGIAQYRALGEAVKQYLPKINQLTAGILEADNISDCMRLIDEHEGVVSKALHLDRAKDLYFKDFEGSVKSLGAWGGDFVMVASKEPIALSKKYFMDRGFEVFKPYNEMVKHN